MLLSASVPFTPVIYVFSQTPSPSCGCSRYRNSSTSSRPPIPSYTLRQQTVNHNDPNQDSHPLSLLPSRIAIVRQNRSPRNLALRLKLARIHALTRIPSPLTSILPILEL